jgi:hypothetical protein
MRKHDVKIELIETRAYNVFCKMFPAGNWNAHLGLFVQDYHGRDVRKPVIFFFFLMHGGTGAPSSVGGVALNNGAVYPLNKVSD